MNTNLVTVKKCSELTGYTVRAIYIKINRGVWRENQHWFKAPDGRNLIDLPAIEVWGRGGAKNG